MEKAGSVTLMKSLFGFAILGITTLSYAGTLNFPSFKITVGDGWVHSLERGPRTQSEEGELIGIYHPDRPGILRIRHINAPDVVSDVVLRNMTNVDLSIPLTSKNWGDFIGYQHDYSESGVFYRQWWLVNERTVVFIVYQNIAESSDKEIDEINKIVNSMEANTP